MTPMGEPRGRTSEERAYYAFSERVYARFARFYDLVTFPLAGLRREVVMASGCNGQSHVLDVATGTGAQAHAFSGIAREVAGADLSEAMLEVARRKRSAPNLRYCQADATDLPFADHSFDVSCISFALHEMPQSVRETALREMVRVTEPGGTLVVVDYALPAAVLWRWFVFHAVKLYERDAYADFVRRDLAQMLRHAGAEVQQHHPSILGAAQILIAKALLRSARQQERRPDGRQL